MIRGLAHFRFYVPDASADAGHVPVHVLGDNYQTALAQARQYLRDCGRPWDAPRLRYDGSQGVSTSGVCYCPLSPLPTVEE